SKPLTTRLRPKIETRSSTTRRFPESRSNSSSQINNTEARFGLELQQHQQHNQRHHPYHPAGHRLTTVGRQQMATWQSTTLRPRHRTCCCHRMSRARCANATEQVSLARLRCLLSPFAFN